MTQSTRLKLRLWLELESINEQIHKALEQKDEDAVVHQIIQYVSKAFDDSSVESLGWKYVVELYYDAVKESKVMFGLPMFKGTNKQHSDDPVWEYPGRSWWNIAHQLAKQYGWTIEYIGELDVRDAMSLIQEIQIDTQLSHEWQWMLSERSVGYDEATKKSKFVPLPRPEWMQATNNIKIITAQEIPNDMKPRGTVMRFRNGKFEASN